MENATKALLIAAAILIAIIIISFGIFVVRQGQEAVQGADLSEAEAAQFNSKFQSYVGNSVSTAQVNALLNTVLSHNNEEKNAGTNRFVSVVLGKNVLFDEQTLTGTKTVLTQQATTIGRITGSNYYKVTYTMTGTRITAMNINKK